MLAGKTHTGTAVHYARKGALIEGFQCYEPACSKKNSRTVAALSPTDEAVTCKRCLSWKIKIDASKAKTEARLQAK